MDIYSVSYDGFQTCNAAEGKLLGSTNCGLNHQKNTKALDFVKKEGETYYLIGELKLSVIKEYCKNLVPSPPGDYF